MDGFTVGRMQDECLDFEKPVSYPSSGLTSYNTSGIASKIKSSGSFESISRIVFLKKGAGMKIAPRVWTLPFPKLLISSLVESL